MIEIRLIVDASRQLLDQIAPNPAFRSFSVQSSPFEHVVHVTPNAQLFRSSDSPILASCTSTYLAVRSVSGSGKVDSRVL